MKEDETVTACTTSPTVNIEIMNQNGSDNRTCEDDDVALKTSLKTTSSLEVESSSSTTTTKSRDMCTDRRKRKSCETETAVEVKRVRTQSADNDDETVKPYQQVENTTPEEIDQGQADSPKTDDSSSSNTTSGVDVTDQPGPSSTSRDNERLEIVNISSFIRYEPCDTKSARPLKSAIKKPDKSGETRTNDKSIKFDVVREFRFNRTQSFVTMPSQGGMSLGMEKSHHGGRELALDRYRIERDRSRRRKLRRWRREQQVDVVTNSSSESESDSDDDQGQDYLSLYPVPPERRRRILERSGYVIENDSVSADNNIRSNRELCGCNCQGICYPETCQCYTNGIGCQVDRLSFPCGCQRDQCWNPNGRTSFNVERVRNHYYRTMERLRDPAFKDDQTDYIPPSENNQQQFSFGDFTLPPKRDPPPRDHYHHSWNHSMSYWNDGSAWNWALEHRYDTNSMNDIGMNQSQPTGCDYQNSFYSNGFHDMGHGHVVSNMNLANVTSSVTSSSGIYGNGTSNHMAKDQCQSTTSICNLKSTIIDSNESERLSESSESGIGEENTESSSTNSSPNVPTIQMCGSIETSMTVAYNDDSNNSLPVPVGSE